MSLSSCNPFQISSHFVSLLWYFLQYSPKEIWPNTSGTWIKVSSRVLQISCLCDKPWACGVTQAYTGTGLLKDSLRVCFAKEKRGNYFMILIWSLVHLVNGANTPTRLSPLPIQLLTSRDIFKNKNVTLTVVCLVEEDGNLNMVSSFKIIWSSITYSHEDTAYTYVWTQSFAYPRAFPEDAHESSVISPVSTITAWVAFRTRSYFDPWCQV